MMRVALYGIRRCELLYGCTGRIVCWQVPFDAWLCVLGTLAR